jgi:hypothetical protein
MPVRKPKVVVTRKLPDPVETRMRELFDVELNADDRAMTTEALCGAPMSWCPPSRTGSTRGCCPAPGRT